jgi:hypothetical protein
MPTVIKNPSTGTPEKFDLQALMTALENPNVKFKDIQPILDASGHTYAEDAVQNANEYITKWNNSDRSRQIFTDLINNSSQLPASRAKKTLALTGRTSFARPTDVDSFETTDYDLDEHLKSIVPTLRNTSGYSNNKQALRDIFNLRKGELKESGYRKPLFHKNRVELADRLVSEDTDRTVDSIVKYRGLMQLLNPTNIQKQQGWEVSEDRTSLIPNVSLALPWRPDPNSPTSKVIPRAKGVVGQYAHGSSADGNQRSSPYIMGLPTGFQNSRKAITSAVGKNPRDLENTATHELSHLVDTPTGFYKREAHPSYMDSIVTSVDKKEGLEDNKLTRYLMRPTETNARIQVLRKHLYSSGIDVFNEPVNWSSVPKNVLEDASTNFGEGGNSALGDLREIYTDEVIEQLLNTLP